jgi:hypothetical protein
MIDGNQKVSVIGLDGRVRWLPAYLLPELQKQGWLLVNNAKRDYYIEHDTTLPSYKKQLQTEISDEVLYVDII